MDSDQDSDSEGEEIQQKIVQKLEAGLSPRPYQTDLLNISLEKNIIVCLGTGTGKTFISVMLIKELAYQVRKVYDEGGKRTFFLVNTVPLVKQQTEVIKKNTDLTVKGYVGEMGVDFWNKAKWLQELNENQVLVMTAQIFVDLLGHGKIRLSNVNLIVFDECHHARKEHPYKQVMMYFDGCPEIDYPRVMGLTASIINGKVKPWRIESEISDLERTMRAACQTSSDVEVGKFATKPEEMIYPYSNSQDSSDVEEELHAYLVEKVLVPWQQFLNDRRVNRDILKVAYTNVKAIARECVETLNVLGASATYRVAGYLIKDLERTLLFTTDDEVKWLYQYCATQLRQFRKIYNNHTVLYEVEDEEYSLLHVSPKLKALVEILKQYGNPQAANETVNAQLCGIVFVERRYTALILSELINLMAQKDEALNFIRCSYVIGHGTGKVGYSSDAEMNSKKQDKVLKQFRKHEINLLIATSVVEEGLDVPKCNFVVRFDFPKNFRSYVQSKGRARAKNSAYIMLVEEQEVDDAQTERETYNEIESYLSRACYDRPLPTDDESTDAVDTDYLPAYRTDTGARITMSNSIPFLCRYCSKLPGDQYTSLMPDFSTEEEGDGAFRSTIMMPMNCPLKDKIEGEVMPRKKLSRMAAAYEACKKLYAIGELDEHLLPVDTVSDESEEEEDDEEDGQKKGKAGTKKRRRKYERKTPDVFVGSLPQPRQRIYLYVIHVRTSRELESQWRFGLVMNMPLPSIRRFKIFPVSGEAIVSIEQHGTQVHLTRTELSLVVEFHTGLMSEVLRIPYEMNADHEDGYYVVLLNSSGDEIDFEQMRSIGESLRDEYKRPRLSKLKSGCSLVTPLHTKNKQRYVVSKVCHELNPRSRFPEPSKASTFEEYYQNEYNKSVADKDQPLIEVKHFSDRVNFLVDRKKLPDRERKPRKEIHFIPELCSLNPLPATLLAEALMLPTILYRVTSMLLALELRETIARGSHFNDLNPEESSLSVIGEPNTVTGMASRSNVLSAPSLGINEEEFKRISKQLGIMFSNKRVRTLHPDSELLLQALTSTSAADAFNLERLEMLGDAFLKQAVSIYLFCFYKNKDEGKLTKRKGKQLSNLALFKVANRNNIPQCLQNTPLDKTSWAPPGLRIADSMDGVTGLPKKVRKLADGCRRNSSDEEVSQTSHLEQAQQKVTTQMISDKSVADSVEALIGAYLISCGYQGALHFLDFIGVKVLPDEQMDVEDDHVKRPCKYANFDHPEITSCNPNQDVLERMSLNLKSFEQRINYTFSNKLYLIQALTHASYPQNRMTDCYQRLEFLGDALLDFLVTELIYSSNSHLSPGQLTDLRQALVNNNIFAKIAVKHGYHHSLYQRSPQWFRKIGDFVDRILEEKAEGREEISADPFLILSGDEEEGVEAPKVLGDIFESVAGAIFLDSGMDVVATWRVYYRMMKPYIDKYSADVPLNPIRIVHEKDSEAEFSKATVLPGGKVTCMLTVWWGDFEGRGSNIGIAKMTAATRAVKALEELQK